MCVYAKTLSTWETPIEFLPLALALEISLEKFNSLRKLACVAGSLSLSNYVEDGWISKYVRDSIRTKGTMQVTFYFSHLLVQGIFDYTTLWHCNLFNANF